MKPEVFILQCGSIATINDPLLGASYDVHPTTGLILYEKDGVKRGMIVDPGRGCDWETIKKGIEAHGLAVADITHVLMTHVHEDHVQNLKEFRDAISVCADHTSYIGRPPYAGKAYPDGIIEVPEIRYVKIPPGHSYRDSLYSIDSANMGVVAFLGDLIFASEKHVSRAMHIAMDASVSIDPLARYLTVKKLLENYPEIETFYPGHDPKPMKCDDLKIYTEGLAGQDFQDHLKRWYEEKVNDLKRERDQL